MWSEKEQQRQGLLQAIKDDPEDDTAPLIYADWLEENGQPERAEYIRLSIRESRASTDAERSDLCSRCDEISGRHWKRWLQPLSRDMVHGLTFDRRRMPIFHLDLDDFLQNAHLFEHTEFFSLELYAPRPEDARRLAACEQLRNLSFLCLAHSHLGNEGLQTLLPHLVNLRHLGISNNWIDNQGAILLAESPSLTSLTTFGLSDNGIGNQRALALAQSPSLPKLECLDLDDDSIRAVRVTRQVNRLLAARQIGMDRGR
jgi:uncharacterized protein (TIGR02996 family)